MTYNEVIDEFIEVREEGSGIQFLVTQIEWMGHKPISSQKLVSEITSPITDEQITKEKRRISKLRRYFKRCVECGELNPDGWMHDSKICQRCAEQNHGVDY